MRKHALWTALVLVTTPAFAAAQEPAQPGVMVISEQKCQRVGELNDWFRENAAPILNDLVEEGRLLRWGIVGHSWGDEWNHVRYFMATDLDAFLSAHAEFITRLARVHPDLRQRFQSHCSEHKDNIYSVVMTEETPL